MNADTWLHSRVSVSFLIDRDDGGSHYYVLAEFPIYYCAAPFSFSMTMAHVVGKGEEWTLPKPQAVLTLDDSCMMALEQTHSFFGELQSWKEQLGGPDFLAAQLT